MSRNIFYADLDSINNKGVLVTGHGKGLVNKNSKINGKYIANDMVRLRIESNELFGYQGYIPQSAPELHVIDYLLYFYDEDEKEQPLEPELISIKEYTELSKHNIDTGEQISKMYPLPFLSSTDKFGDTYNEYTEILSQASKAKFYKIPFTKDENERAIWVNNLVQ
ncbi:hypothetical protein ACSQ34_14685 (plasmid) [Enterococcus mundtii]|uniref:hypothetical protein n=1 Tax=Enterococcus mundtii TaxID=53346 RepID=UPI00403CE5C1